MGFTATDARNQTWLISGVHRRPISWAQANALAALAPPAAVPHLGAIGDEALSAYLPVA